VKPAGGIPRTQTPRWVFVFAIIIVVLTLVFAGLHLTGNGMGNHGSP